METNKATVPTYIREHGMRGPLTVMVRNAGESEYKTGLKGYDERTTAYCFCAEYGRYFVDRVEGNTIYSTYRL